MEDDRDDRLLFSTTLAEIDEKITLNFAISGWQALEMLEQCPVLPDVIFLDYHLPLMNGYDCLCEIKKRERLKHVPVVVWTVSPLHRQKCFDAGAQTYLIKPSAGKQFAMQLKQIIYPNFPMSN